MHPGGISLPTQLDSSVTYPVPSTVLRDYQFYSSEPKPSLLESRGLFCFFLGGRRGGSRLLGLNKQCRMPKDKSPIHMKSVSYSCRIQIKSAKICVGRGVEKRVSWGEGLSQIYNSEEASQKALPVFHGPLVWFRFAYRFKNLRCLLLPS